MEKCTTLEVLNVGDVVYFNGIEHTILGIDYFGECVLLTNNIYTSYTDIYIINQFKNIQEQFEYIRICALLDTMLKAKDTDQIKFNMLIDELEKIKVFLK